ncbi:MAG: hypothetical protein U0263_18250 [Polyangiaceae bacterium]
MKTAVSLGSLLLLSSVLMAGCTAEMAPEDEALLANEGTGESSAAPEEAAPAEESVAESSQAICSCAVELVCGSGRQLTVYEHSDCCGGNFFFCPGNYPDLRKFTTNLFWGANWNDRISRVFTTAKVGVYLYQNVNYGGDVKYIGPDRFVDLGPTLWNDQVSSIKVVALK